MPIVLNGTTGITNDSGYTGDGVSFADSTPANTLVTTSGGNVGIGTSSPSRTFDVNGFISASDGTTRTEIVSGGGVGYVGTQSNHPLAFQTNNAERMRIDSSGNLLVGTTSGFTSDTRVSVASPSGGNGMGVRVGSNGNYAMYVQNVSGTLVGGVIGNASTTSYNTSSDYRLKHDIQPMTGALAKVAALKPVTYKWNTDDSDGEGFIAHELAEVCPDAVTGEKDAVNEDGSIKPQGIDTSFLVATLTAAIQELKAELDSLKAQINGAQA